MLSWAPIIGDPITLIAGIFKVSFKTFFLIVAVAKTSRYVLIAIFTKKLTLGPEVDATIIKQAGFIQFLSPLG